MTKMPDARVIPIRPVAAAAGAPEVVSLYQKRQPIYARAVSGRYATWRWVFVWLTQLFFYGLPWLEIGGRQAVLFDLDAQRFYLFDLVLVPQDLIYLAGLLVLSALALFFFTAVAGRLWCGYACPQTVYTSIFMWIERRFEGDRLARMRLDRAPWSAAKVARRSGKIAAWTVFSLVTGLTFVGWFTPIREFVPATLQGEIGGWSAFWALFYGAFTYGNAGLLREQMCKYICPYARFQSAMIDRDSLVIAYDAGRGEPRGARSKKADAGALGLGSCVDCTLCVQVCPTGIDIRHGLQNECIGCAACIDACDGVMDKMGYARGLIRYSTENAVAGGWSRRETLRRVLRPRVLIYGALLSALTLAFAASLALRSPFQFDVLKDRSTLARLVDEGAIENVYRLQVTNRSEHPQQLVVSAEGPAGLVVDAQPITVDAAGAAQVVVRLRLPAEAAAALAGQSVPVAFVLSEAAHDGEAPLSRREKSTFLVPR
ncbi:cytochrome c oxidase cbb3 type, accessory protein FixG [Rubrivivax gelatinosus IL144]|uniref:Cytochrome c oxidase cbb3 type, accessory protein FixG n=2 Tax=Rubrivivax gelatinosus TaxID=28068 RepID=I0HR17_RUBGI|nr:cytochrome c oxidase cbb3 type, accessory protein FixG [Rubrivivax gelatinosus IL144]